MPADRSENQDLSVAELVALRRGAISTEIDAIWMAEVERLEAEIDRLRTELDAKPRTHPWFASPPDHMKGWEAFGVAPGERTVRRLGVVTFKKGQAVTDEQPGTEPWGRGEVVLGVAGINISASGDGPNHAFIQVVGTTEADVAARWDAVAEAWVSIRTDLWPKSRGPHSGSSKQEDQTA